ncbi:MAG: hypothetical protein ACTS27_11200 [Phycisphaerales bacterium]
MPGVQRGVMIGMVGAALVFACGAAQAAAQDGAQSQSRRPARVDPDPRVKTLREMQKRVTVELTDARLEDVIMFIEQAGNLPLDVLWLDDDNPLGLDKDETISLNARNATIQSLLEAALDKAGDEFSEATWQLTVDGILEVGPKERLNQRKSVKIYDINALLFVIPNFTDVPELDLDAVLQQGQGGGGGGRGVFRVEDAEETEPSEEERVQEIVDIITSTVEPEQWQVNGGTGANLRYYRGSLLISAPDYIHRQIGGYDFVR